MVRSVLVVTEAFYGRWELLEGASDEIFTRCAHLRHFFLFVPFSEIQPLPVVCLVLFEGSGKITVQTSSYYPICIRDLHSSCALNPKDCSSGNLIESKPPFGPTRLIIITALLMRYSPSPHPLLSHVPALPSSRRF